MRTLLLVLGVALHTFSLMAQGPVEPQGPGRGPEPVVNDPLSQYWNPMGGKPQIYVNSCGIRNLIPTTNPDKFQPQYPFQHLGCGPQLFNGVPFDWREKYWPFNIGVASNIPSPFNPLSGNSNLIYLWDRSNNATVPNYNVEDGWEVINYQYPNTLPYMNREFAYVILYNKYTGILRVLASASRSSYNLDYQAVRVSLRFNGTNGEFAALLYPNSGKGQAMDTPTDALNTSKICKMPSIDGQFFHADFQMAYDPCVCRYSSQLSCDFELIQNSEVNLGGRMVTSTTSLGNIAAGNITSALLENEFLTNMQVDGSGNIEGGSLVFKNINEMRARYRILRAQRAELLDQYGPFEAIENFSKFVDIAWGGTQLALGLPVLNGGNKLFFDTPKGKATAEDVNKGLGLFGKVVDFASAPLKKKLAGINSRLNQMDAITLSHTEMRLSGNISTARPLSTSSVFRTPGALALFDPCQETTYPMYDAPLGRFALTNTPEVLVKIFDEVQATQFDDMGMPTAFSSSVLTSFELSNELLYNLNPVLDWNKNATKISAAIVISCRQDIPNAHLRNLEKVMAGRDGVYQYMTPFLSLNNLRDLKAGVFSNFAPVIGSAAFGGIRESDIVKIEIRFANTYIFNSIGSMGHLNMSQEIITFPSGFEVIQELEPFQISESQTFRRTIPATNFTTSQDIFAWDQIDITGNLTAAPGVVVNIICARIDEASNITIGPGVNLVRRTYPTVLPTVDWEMSPGKLNVFCGRDGGYRGNDASKSRAIELAENEKVVANSFSLSPNPTNGMVTLKALSEEVTIDRFTVSDITGRVFISQDNVLSNATEIDLSTQPNGIYFVSILSNDKVQTVKVIKN